MLFIVRYVCANTCISFCVCLFLSVPIFVPRGSGIALWKSLIMMVVSDALHSSV